MKHFALAGNPNCGKTTLYNALTGSTAHVGNWPGVTVEKREGTYKKLEEPISIVDLPGIYSLSPYTPEEVISRDYIVESKPDCVINIIDGTNLERNLYLTTQILEMDVPVVVAVNMMDLVEKNGDRINCEELERKLGIPVVAISAQHNTNMDILMKRAYEESLNKRVGSTILEGSEIKGLIDDVKKELVDEEVPSPTFYAIKLIEEDEIIVKKYPKAFKLVSEYKQTFNSPIFGNDLEAFVADAKYKYIVDNYSPVKTKVEEKEVDSLEHTRKIDKVLTNRWAGIPIFLVILFLIFHLTFSENLFYLGGIFSANGVHPSFEGSMFEGLFWTDAGINSPGVILQSFVTNCTDKLSEVFANGLASAGAAPWVSGLLVDGICAGVFAVLSFVPQILLLFLFFSILEDTGYMARVAFILDRMFRKLGLSGRAFLPMIMGFGCSVPAMINTRTLAEEKERIATIRVIPFFSCGAKLPILTAIAGGICQVFGFPNVDLITYSMYLVGICTALVTVILMRNTTLRGAIPPFIMELPQYHMPQAKALMIHLWDKLKGYVKKAFTIILVSTIVIWVLQSFTFSWKYIESADAVGIINDNYALVVDEDAIAEKKKEIEDNSELSLDEKTEAKAELDENHEVYMLALAELDAEFVDETGAAAVEFADIYNKYVELDESEDAAEKEAATVAYNNLIVPVVEAALADYHEVVNDPEYIDSSDSILAGIGKMVQPLFTPVGFGSQLNENGWVFGVSAVTGLIAKENVIATFSVLAQSVVNKSVNSVDDYLNKLYTVSSDEEGVPATVALIENTGIELKGWGFKGWSILIAFIIFNMTTIPCFAAVATARGELGHKYFKNTVIFWLVTSYLVASAFYLVLSAWWTTFIILALLAACITSICLLNKKKSANIA